MYSLILDTGATITLIVQAIQPQFIIKCAICGEKFHDENVIFGETEEIIDETEITNQRNLIKTRPVKKQTD